MSETKPRVAIATGAPGGIGRAMVRGLLAAGMRVAGVDRDRDPLEALAAAAREQGKAAELLTLQTDLTLDSAADEIGGATRARRAHRQAELARSAAEHHRQRAANAPHSTPVLTRTRLL